MKHLDDLKAQPFDQLFGELRSLLNTPSLAQAKADEVWFVLFAMASQNRLPFLAEVMPYVEGTGFFGQGHTIPMFRDESTFESAYEALGCDAAMWVEYSDYDDLYSYECYGVSLDFKTAALLGCTEDMAYVWRDALDEDRVIVGMNPWPLLTADLKVKAKLKKARAEFDAIYGPSLELLGVSEAPEFYVYLQGYKVQASLILGGLDEIEDSDGEWCSDVDGGGLDVLRPHDRYDQDMELDGPAYACVDVGYYGGQGISRITLSQSTETRALKRLKAAGRVDPKPSYGIVVHM